MYKYFKRLFDFLIASLLIILVLLVIMVFGILIKREDGGSIFYISERLGRNGKKFNLIKLRSMNENAPDLRNEDGSTFNSDNDPRLLSIGKFIRKYSIDELPQIINVLKGDMSLIGPRPDLPDAIHIYTEQQKKKLNVRPGITGYSQAYYRNSISANEKFNNDIYYVDNFSFCLDIKIMLKTISSILLHRNIYSN